MAEQQDVEDLKSTTGKHTPVASDDYISLPPEEEILRLRKLQVNDLITELFFARQRLKNFLQERGIAVPETIFEDETHKNLLDLNASVYINNFTRREILNIPDSANAVNSTVKSFVMLFDSLISTNAFEEVLVSVEGVDEVITVKQLLEDYDSNKVDEEKKVVVAVHDLRDQLEALIDENSSGNKNFENIDDDAIAATRELGADGVEKLFDSKLGEGGYAFSEYSPFISQEMFNSMFSELQFTGQEDDKSAKNAEGLLDDSTEIGEDIVFDDSTDIEEIEEVVPGGAADEVFEDFDSFEEKSDEKLDIAGDAEMSEDDIEAMLKAGQADNETVSENDIDALFNGDDDDDDDDNISEDDIEDMLAGNDVLSAEPDDATKNMSEDDIEAMLAGNDAVSTEPDDATKNMSEDDIEAMLAGNDTVSAEPTMEEEDAKPFTSDDIEAMVAEAAAKRASGDFDEDISGSSTSVKDPGQAVSMDALDNFETMASPDEDWENTIKKKTKHAYNDGIIAINKISSKTDVKK
ncbi:MAG: hypothetical protein JXR78_06840 [Victivallales bacterium]|nr:hypothetical protein [Victivallales bacterium]